MSLQEAAFFYGDYSELIKEFEEILALEKVADTTTQEEIHT